MKPAVAHPDWPAITAELDREGYAVLPRWLDASDSRALAQQVLAARPCDTGGLFDQPEAKGTSSWTLPACPPALNGWRDIHTALLPLAQRWAQAMGSDMHSLADPGTGRPQFTASRLRTGDEQPLHHGSTDARCFPLQLVLLLSAPGDDFTGGEFVMTEQRPRMQSRPMVVPLRQGDAALVTVAHRPMRGLHGNYRVTLKQAISRVRSGERVGLSLQFPAAP